ncbi:unnamed protein product [Sphagnum balticum]
MSRFGGVSMVDHMMMMMEKYAGDLESLVEQRNGRTGGGTEAGGSNPGAGRIKIGFFSKCAQLLPRSIANALRNGTPVEPELYNSGLVAFVDIVVFHDFLRRFGAISNCAHVE